MEEWYDSSKRTASCVTMSAFRNALRRSLLPSKRHTAIFCYNSPPWIWQAQQLWQRLTPQRRIQSSAKKSKRDANTTCGADVAGFVTAPATASMTCFANIARIVAAPAFASMERDAADAWSVAVLAYAITASSADVAPSVRTSHAQLKAAPCSVTVSAQPKSYCTTCAPSTAASPKPSQNPRN